MIAILVVSSNVLAQDIKKGDEAKVPIWEWVNVKNPNPVKSGNSTFSYDDFCGIQYGGTVTMVGIEGDNLLVRYSIDGTQYGTPCPDGALFFITKERFSKMTDEYNRIFSAKKAEKNLVQKLLNN